MKKTGILLINLGTPSAPTTSAVRHYLREFLSDPYVIDLPALARWLLLNTIILPFRAPTSTKAYQAIWTPQGSPLLVNSLRLTEKLQEKLTHYPVAFAMRYGHPTMDQAITTLLSQDIDGIMLVPLYPQYAEATTKSSLLAAEKIIRAQHPTIKISSSPSFYDHPDYIQAMVQLIKTHPQDKTIDHFIFSYHGLPERQVRRVCSPKNHCDLKQACPVTAHKDPHCYRAQCYATARLMASSLGLEKDDYHVTFQSRLGKTPWIGPYTDQILVALAEKGMKNLAIVCPSFVADCLETLEEIDLRATAQWRALGGHTLTRIPCLNDAPRWVDALSHIILDALR